MHTADSPIVPSEQLNTDAAAIAVSEATPSKNHHVNMTNCVIQSGLVASGIEGISMTGCGLVVDNAEISTAEFNSLFRNVLTLHKSSCWLLGDTLLLGEKRWGSRITKDKYEEAAAATGMSRGTLHNIVLTCSRFPLEARHPELSFTHHQEVAATDANPDQRAAVLEQAAQEKMSCTALRKHLHKTRFTEPDEPEEKYDESVEPGKLLDPANPMSIINLPERSAPDAPPLWDALKFVDWVDKQDPDEYNLEQCQQALKLSEPIVAYHAAVLERFKALNDPETAQNG